MYEPTDTPPPQEVLYTVPQYHQPQYVVEKPTPSCCSLKDAIFITAALVVIVFFGTCTALVLTNWRSLTSAASDAGETMGQVKAKTTQVMDMVSNVNDLTKGFKAINSTALAQNIESGSRYSAEMLKSMNSKRSVSVTLQLPFGGGDEQAEDPPGDDGGEPGAPPRKDRPPPRQPLPAEP